MIPIEIQDYSGNIQFQIGQRIQQKRLEKHLKAADVAPYLNIKPNQMSKIENGRSSCTIQQLFVLAQLLECSADYLLYGEKDKRVCLNEQQQTAINNMIVAFRDVAI